MIHYPQRASLLLSLLLIMMSGVVSVAQCPSRKAPPSLVSYVAEQFPDWRIVEVKDLLDYHQQLWRSEHPAECPGVAVGRFEPTGLWKWAILLVPKAETDNRAKALLLKEQGSGYTSMTLAEVPNRGNVPVLAKAAPGLYKSYDSAQRVRTRYSVVSLIFYESSASVFYWDKGKFHEIQVSD
jgi:hypothetical protein